MLSRTRKYEAELGEKVKEATKLLLVVEGAIDKDYIMKAAEARGKSELISKFEVLDGNGYGGLNKIWKKFHLEQWTNPNQVVILLYDCDVGDKNSNAGKAFQRTIPVHNSTIMKGIENLLPQSTIDRAINHKIVFFDYEPEVTKLVRGKKVTEPEKWSINPDEKRNLCDWICQNGDAEDFKQFDTVFEILNDCGVD